MAPKADSIKEAIPRTYSLADYERLLSEADRVGDHAAYKVLAAKVKAMGGDPGSSEIPANETLLERLRRLLRQANRDRDTASVRVLQDKIAVEELKIAEPEEAEETPETTEPAEVGETVETPIEDDADGEDAGEEDEDDTPEETEEETAAVNNGDATGLAAAMIKASGYNIAEIPSRTGGKVTQPDVVAYEALIADR